ncbi:hypothetical protein PENTCL1PPCAC_26902, partial [Pristionchus entomophagus]
SQRIMDGIKEVLHKANRFSSSNRVGNILQKSMDLLQILMENEADSQNLGLVTSSLERELLLVKEMDSIR